MNTKTYAVSLLSSLCISAAFAASYTLDGGTLEAPLDIMDPASWGATVLEATDVFNIQGSGENMAYAYIGSGGNFEGSNFNMRGNAVLTMNGVGSSIASTSNPIQNNAEFGTNANSSMTLNILGSGNSFTIDHTARSLMYGNENSVSGTNLIRISSNDAAARNTLSLTGVHGFIKLSTNAASTANNTISIGDNSDFVQNYANLRLGGDSGGGFAGGKVAIEMDGTNSTFNSATPRNLNMGNDSASGIMTGGEVSFSLSGDSNTAKFALLNMGANWQSGAGMSGGKISFDVSGASNTLAFSAVTMGNVNNADGGGEIVMTIGGSGNDAAMSNLYTRSKFSAFVISGSGNTVSTGHSAVNGGTWTIGGEGNSFKTGDVTLDGGKITLYAGNRLDMSQASMYVKAGSEFELVADAGGFLGSDGNSALTLVNMSEFAGVLVLDFSKYVMLDEMLGDDVKLMSVTSAKSGISADDLNGGATQVVVKGGAIEDGSFNWIGGDLYVHVNSVIPEPSAFASLLGALALALAARSRRR